MVSSLLRTFPVKFGLLTAVLLWAAACSNKDLINKTKYDGKSYTNTCQGFKTEVASLTEANSGNTKLTISEYDNTENGPNFLEPGQFVQQGDTLYFRLANDLEYGKYLQKGVSVQVKASFAAQDHLKALEKEPAGDLGMLVVNEAYWKANKQPYLTYKMPVQQRLNGKQLTLLFTIVKYDKTGKLIKKVFCDTEKAPLGPLTAPCCTDKPWDQVKLRSAVQIPDLDIKDETYRYAAFTGTLDLIFPMSSTKFDRKELNNVLSTYIKKYEQEGYKVKDVSITGFASQGGKVEYNQRLAENRSLAVKSDLDKAFKKEGQDSVAVQATGKGEDWDRLDLLVKTAVFNEEERNQVLNIAGDSRSLDEKEAELRKLPYWKKLVSEVLTYCRHTFITFNFNYAQQGLASGTYSTPIPVIAPELYNVATQKNSISRYQRGNDPTQNMKTLNELIEDRGNRTANLYAMRSTYYFGSNDVDRAIRDIDQAQQMDNANAQYGLASLAYKTANAYNMSLDDRMKLLNTYNDYVARYPNDVNLQLNRAVMMDRVGFLSGALAEYDKLMSQGAKNAAALNNRGVARLKASRLVEAEADFNDAASADPTLAEPFFNLGVVYAYKGLTQRAVDALDKALAINPSLKAEIAANPAFRVMRDQPKFSKYR